MNDKPPLRAHPEDRVGKLLRRMGLVLAALIPLGIFAAFFFYPVVALVGRGLVGPGGGGPTGIDLTGFADVVGRPRFFKVAWFTLWQAAVSAGLSVLLGIPGAHLLYRRSFRGRSALRALVTIPFVLPTVVVGLAFRTLFASSGPLGSWGLDGTVWAILLAQVFLNYAVVVRTVGTTWAQLDQRPEEAAQALGASPTRAFLTITLPALGPAIAAAGTLVFLFCATSFGIMVVLGGGKFNSLETEIFRQTTQMLDLRTASVLSIVQILLVGTVLGIAARIRHRTESTLRLQSHVGAKPRVSAADWPVVLVTGVVVALLVAPMVTLLGRSLHTETGWGFGNFDALASTGDSQLLIVSGWTALGNSASAAAIAAALAITLGVLLSMVLARKPRQAAARRSLTVLDGFFMLPLGVSAATVGFGFLIALDKPPLDFRGSALLVPIAQAMVATPLVVRMILPVLRATDDRLRQAAGMLGASPVRVWLTVDLPIMSRALAGATAFAFAVALGEFGATSFVARPERITLPILIGRLISRPGAGNLGMACAAAIILAAVCAGAVFLVDRSVGARRGAAGIGAF
ncbi:iron ABC transporter permease [Nakamurella antarctica]|uniref:Iron ABC transporter permease n=1 Tax=Nakamurella antarctica TaxID=1902245 RepID=A0A3G8ZKX6_9ACTN|nr:iron ABC transporter permease [Nakamurella antarctica]AZI57437.1 iron ABC transporter permease [Nakamurella antarctica]